jgi:hypothetical protein
VTLLSDPTLGMIGFTLSGIIALLGGILLTRDDDTPDRWVFTACIGAFAMIYVPWTLPWSRFWTWCIGLGITGGAVALGGVLNAYYARRRPD